MSNISGVTTQFVKAKNVTGKNPDDICRGLWNKDNIKFGGTNWKVKVNFTYLDQNKHVEVDILKEDHNFP